METKKARAKQLNIPLFLTQTGIFLVPLFFLPVTRDFFAFNKHVLIVFFALVLLAAYASQTIRNRHIAFKTHKLDKYVVFFALAYLASLIFSGTNWIEALLQPSGAATVIALTLIYLLLRQFVALNKTTQLLAPLLSSAAVLSAFVAFSVGGVIGRLPFDTIFKLAPITPAGAPLALAAFLGIVLLIAGSYILQNTQKAKLSYIILTLIALAGFLISVYVLFQDLTKPQLLPANAAWTVAAENIKKPKNALIGSGPNFYVNAFTVGRPQWLNGTDLWNVRFDQASNYYLHVLTEIGFLGLLSLLLLIYVLAKSKQKHFALFAVLLLLIFVPMNILVLFLFYLLLIFTTSRNQRTVVFPKQKAGASTSHDTSPEIAKAFDPENKEVTLTVHAGLVIGILLFILVAFGGFYTVQAYRAEVYMARGLRSALTPNNQQTYDLQLKAILINPFDSEYRTIFAQTNLALANVISAQKDMSDVDRQTVTQLVTQSVNNAKLAIQLYPSAGTWEGLAAIYKNLINVAEGAAEWTIGSYNQAIVFDPTNPLLRVALGQVYYSLGAMDQAERQFEIAVYLKPDLATAWYNLANAQRERNKTELARASYSRTLALVNKGSADFDQVKKELDALPEPPQAQQQGLESLTGPEASTSANFAEPVEVGQEAAPEFTVSEEEAEKATEGEQFFVNEQETTPSAPATP